jgi:hypothetical protein
VAARWASLFVCPMHIAGVTSWRVSTHLRAEAAAVVRCERAAGRSIAHPGSDSARWPNTDQKPGNNPRQSRGL